MLADDLNACFGNIFLRCLKDVLLIKNNALLNVMNFLLFNILLKKIQYMKTRYISIVIHVFTYGAGYAILYNIDF